MDSWEFQFMQPGGSWQWVMRVEPVDGCASCFEARASIPESAFLMRSRSVGEGGVSAWSEPLTVPEPGFLTAMLLGAMWIALLGWAAKRIR